MVEHDRESNNEVEQFMEDNSTENDGNDENSHRRNSSFLVEMNLIVVLLSLVSMSEDEDCSGFVDRRSEEKSLKGDEGKAYVPRLNTRRKETNGVRCMGRRPQRFQPIKDVR